MGQAATYRQVFAVREYRHLFGAYVLSLVGDQLTAVTVSFIVYSSTGSALLAAAAFASSYLAWLVGGPLLSGFADRFPRRRVMVVCDLARAVAIPLLVLPMLPPATLVALAFALNLLRPPFVAARAALMPELLDGDRYPVANGLDNIAAQVAQVGGFAIGGALVTLLTPQGAVLVDAGTFVLSALLLLRGVPASPAPAPRHRAEQDGFGAAVRVVLADRTLRGYLLLLWIAGTFACAAEGLAVPLAAQYGGGPATVGLLLACAPFGMTVGGIAVTRFCPPEVRARLIPLLAVLSVLVLVAVGTAPPPPVLMGLLVLSGLGTAFAVPLNSMFGRAVPSAYRGRAFGVALTGLAGLQGLGMVSAGAAADLWPATAVVGATGLLGTAAVLSALALWPTATGAVRRSRTARDRWRSVSRRLLATGHEQARTVPNTSGPSRPESPVDTP